MAYNAKYSSCNDFEFLAGALNDFCREIFKESKDKHITTTSAIRELQERVCYSTISTEKIYKKYKKNYNIKFIPFSIVIMYYNVLKWVETLNNPVDIEEWIYMVRDFVEYSMLMKKMYFIYDFVEIGDINQDGSKTIINLKTRHMSVEIIIDKTKINNPLSQNIALSMMLHEDEEEFVTLMKINVKDIKDNLISTFDFISDENINIKELSDDILLNNVMTEINREIINYFKRSLNDMFHLITDTIYYDIEDIIRHGVWISKE